MLFNKKKLVIWYFSGTSQVIDKFLPFLHMSKIIDYKIHVIRNYYTNKWKKNERKYKRKKIMMVHEIC